MFDTPLIDIFTCVQSNYFVGLERINECKYELPPAKEYLEPWETSMMELFCEK